MADQELTRISDMVDPEVELNIKLSRGLQFDLQGGTTQMVSYAYVYEVRRNDSGRELKPKPLWGPIGIPDNPNASKADLLRAIADAFDADETPKEPDA